MDAAWGPATLDEATATDIELLEAWRGGSESAGNQLVRRHFASVSRFFRNKVPDQRADLMQRTFLACVESRDRVPDGLPFRVYLLGIARRVLAQHFRRLAREKGIRGGASQLFDLAGSPSAVMADKQEQQVLLRALRELELDLQIVLELYYWEQLSTAEIGTVLEIPAGTVKSRLHRARGQLKAAIESVAQDSALAESTVQNLELWAKSLRRYLEREP